MPCAYDMGQGRMRPKKEHTMNIQWYPGHKAKARRLLGDQLKRVDIAVELCDARAPLATRNPELDRLCAGKKRLIVLNKADLADERVTREWVKYFRERGIEAVAFRSTNGKPRDVLAPLERLTASEVNRMKARGVNKTVRGMVIGRPNVGKSTFINRLYGSAIVKAADRPGVTRSNQWVKVGQYLEMLDTPGMLWPKLSDQEGALMLAFIGTIRDQITDTEGLSIKLLDRLMELAPQETCARFHIADENVRGSELLDAVCRGRGFLLSGGRMNTERGAAVVLDEYRAGKVARLTWQRPNAKAVKKSAPAAKMGAVEKSSAADAKSAEPDNGGQQ